jgi:hypothetical protein
MTTMSAGDAVTHKSSEAKTVSAQPDTTPSPDPEPKAKPAAAKTEPKPPVKEPDQPNVRGPIDCDTRFDHFTRIGE